MEEIDTELSFKAVADAITVKAPEITAPGLDQALVMARQLHSKVNTVEVTDDTLKRATDVLSFLRVQEATLTTARKKARAEIMSVYDDFDTKCDAVTDEIQAGVKTLHDKKLALEEERREQVKKDARERFELFAGPSRRTLQASYAQLLVFDAWWKPQYANKGISQSKRDDSIVSWIKEQCDTLDEIRAEFADDHDLGNAVFLQWRKTRDLDGAKKLVRLQRAVDNALGDTDVSGVQVLLTNTNDAAAVEQFLKVHNIENITHTFTKKDVNSN